LGYGGLVVNNLGALVTGGSNGVFVKRQSGTVVNAGLISGIG